MFKNNNIIFTDNEETIKAKMKLKILLKSITQCNIIYNFNKKNNYNDIGLNVNNVIVNNDDINTIIEDYKYKLIIIRQIYKNLQSFEKQINDNQDNTYNLGSINNFTENLNTEYCITLLLKYTKKYFNKKIQDMNLKERLIKYIDNTLELIEKKKIDISQINLSSIDPEITQSLTSIITNLILKYRRYKLFNAFIRIKSCKKIDKIKRFLNKGYLIIYKGENIMKINFGNPNMKDKFTRIDNESDCLQIYEKSSSSSKLDKNFYLDNILKVVVGIKTMNVKSKLKKLKIIQAEKPYLFLSLILRKRTVDFVFNNGKNAKNWFYGLYYFYSQLTDRPYKICSCTSYILFRIKCKAIKKLNGKIQKPSFTSCMLNCLKLNN